MQPAPFTLLELAFKEVWDVGSEVQSTRTEFNVLRVFDDDREKQSPAHHFASEFHKRSDGAFVGLFRSTFLELYNFLFNYMQLYMRIDRIEVNKSTPQFVTFSLRELLETDDEIGIDFFESSVELTQAEGHILQVAIRMTQISSIAECPLDIIELCRDSPELNCPASFHLIFRLSSMTAETRTSAQLSPQQSPGSAVLVWGGLEHTASSHWASAAKFSIPLARTWTLAAEAVKLIQGHIRIALIPDENIPNAQVDDDGLQYISLNLGLLIKLASARSQIANGAATIKDGLFTKGVATSNDALDPRALELDIRLTASLDFPSEFFPSRLPSQVSPLHNQCQNNHYVERFVRAPSPSSPMRLSSAKHSPPKHSISPRLFNTPSLKEDFFKNHQDTRPTLDAQSFPHSMSPSLRSKTSPVAPKPSGQAQPPRNLANPIAPPLSVAPPPPPPHRNPLSDEKTQRAIDRAKMSKHCKLSIELKSVKLTKEALGGAAAAEGVYVRAWIMSLSEMKIAAAVSATQWFRSYPGIYTNVGEEKQLPHGFRSFSFSYHAFQNQSREEKKKKSATTRQKSSAIWPKSNKHNQSTNANPEKLDLNSRNSRRRSLQSDSSSPTTSGSCSDSASSLLEPESDDEIDLNPVEREELGAEYCLATAIDSLPWLHVEVRRSFDMNNASLKYGSTDTLIASTRVDLRAILDDNRNSPHVIYPHHEDPNRACLVRCRKEVALAFSNFDDKLRMDQQTNRPVASVGLTIYLETDMPSEGVIPTAEILKAHNVIDTPQNRNNYRLNSINFDDSLIDYSGGGAGHHHYNQNFSRDIDTIPNLPMDLNACKSHNNNNPNSDIFRNMLRTPSPSANIRSSSQFRGGNAPPSRIPAIRPSSNLPLRPSRPHPPPVPGGMSNAVLNSEKKKLKVQQEVELAAYKKDLERNLHEIEAAIQLEASKRNRQLDLHDNQLKQKASTLRELTGQLQDLKQKLMEKFDIMDADTRRKNLDFELEAKRITAEAEFRESMIRSKAEFLEFQNKALIEEASKNKVPNQIFAIPLPQNFINPNPITSNLNDPNANKNYLLPSNSTLEPITTSSETSEPRSAPVPTGIMNKPNLLVNEETSSTAATESPRININKDNLIDSRKSVSEMADLVLARINVAQRRVSHILENYFDRNDLIYSRGVIGR